MKIFGISLIKNEADIVEYHFQQTLLWADKIFVYDNGSTDETWEIVQKIAKTEPRVVAWKSEARPYDDGLRAEVFAAFRYEANPGDWWCFILDADEFYIDDPKIFLPKISTLYHVVKTESFEYKITHEDIEEFSYVGRFPEDLEKVKYYSPRAYSEKRFFRHRDNLIWPNNCKFPEHIGVTFPKAIRIRHYQHRSPQQIKYRVETRLLATKQGYQFFKKDNVENWQDKLMYRSELILDDGKFVRHSILDNNIIPWYWTWFQIAMHFFKIYP